MTTYKLLSSQSFQIGEHINVSCRCEDTRYGFRHTARLLQTGETAKVCYYNRTWESWEFQSVLRELAQKVGGSTGDAISSFCEQDHSDRSAFNTIALVAAFGDILTENQAQANDWKRRMIQAGLPQLEVPSDWDTLSEDEKQRRLDAAIGELKG